MAKQYRKKQISLFDDPRHMDFTSKEALSEYLKHMLSQILQQTQSINTLYYSCMEETFSSRRSWNKCYLKEAADVDAHSLHPSEDSRLSVSCIPVSALSEEYGTIATEIVKEEKAIPRGWKCVERGDVLFSRICPSMENGKHAVIESLHNNRGFASPEFFVLKPHVELHPYWLLCFFRRKSFLKQMKDTARGTVQQRISRNYMENLQISFPKRELQEKLLVQFFSFQSDIKEMRQHLSLQAQQIRQFLRQLKQGEPVFTEEAVIFLQKQQSELLFILQKLDRIVFSEIR